MERIFFLEVVWRHNLDTIVTLGATGDDTRCSQFPAYSKMNSLNRLDSLPPTANNGTSTTTAAPRQPGFLSRLIGKGAPRAAVSLRGSCTTRTDSSAAAVPATIEYRPHVSGDENSHGQIWQGRTFYHCPHHGKDGMMVLHAPHQCKRSENSNAATTSNPVPPNDWLESMATSANGQLRAWYLPLYQRREIYQRLPDVLLGTVLEHAWEDHPAGPPPEQELEPSQQVTWLLQDHVRTALNVELDVHSRKAARDRLTLLLCLLDEAEQEYKQPQQQPVEVDPSQELNSTADDSLEPAVATPEEMQVAEDDAPATNVEAPSRGSTSSLPPAVTAVTTASSGSSSTAVKPSSLAEGSDAVATTGQRDPPPVASAAPPPYERRSSAAPAPRPSRRGDSESTRPTVERSYAALARRSSNASAGSANSDNVDHRSRSDADRPRAPPARQSSTTSSTASSHRDADYRSRSDADRTYAPPVRHSSTGSSRGEVDYRSRCDVDRPPVPPPYAWEKKQSDSPPAAAGRSGNWKTVPPGPNEPTVQYQGGTKFYWCPYHRFDRGLWSMHNPLDCGLNPANKRKTTTPSPPRVEDKQSPPEVTRQNTSTTTGRSPPEPRSLSEDRVSQGRKRPRSDEEVEARPAPRARNVEARPPPSPPKPIDPKLEKYRNDMVARRTALKNAIPKAIWPPRDKPLSINFMEDAVAKGKRGGFRRDRKPTVVAALARPISVDAGIACMDWLEAWEPFWQLLPEAVMQVGSTYVAEDKFGAPEVKLNTTGQLTVYISKFSEILGMRGASPKWGKPYEGALSPHDGDTTLLLHMAPLSSVMTNKVGKHLWPLGTFLVIDGSPVKITQRDQNLDDKWYGPSLPLDVTQYVKDPKKPLTIELGCHESVPFVYCLAVHKYRTVGDFIETLRFSMNRASPDDGVKKVCSLLKAASTTICIDTDEDEPDDKEIGKLVFSLRCPLTRKPIETPIRGKNCKHFQVSDILFPM
jgi:hypothetical protein